MLGNKALPVLLAGCWECVLVSLVSKVGRMESVPVLAKQHPGGRKGVGIGQAHGC